MKSDGSAGEQSGELDRFPHTAFTWR